jgi:hypothetical protein
MKRALSTILIFTIASVSFWTGLDKYDLPQVHALTPVSVESVGLVEGDLIGTAILNTQLNTLATAGHTAALVPLNAVTAQSTEGSFTISNVLNGIAVALARAIIQSLTRSIVMWINSGFQGSPAFVTDLNAYLTATVDHIAGNLIADIAGGDFICSPFKLQLASILRNQYFGGLFLNKCTLTGIIANVQNFAANPISFSQSGGWGGWLTLSSQPQNNIYGAYFAAGADLSLKLTNAAGQSIKLLDWGHGFLSWCGSGNTSNGNLTNLGDNKEFAQDQKLVGIRAAPLNNAQSCTNSDGTPGKIQTPGSVIENELEFQLGTGVRQLELTQSINEIVSALMQQLLVQALGATGLAGLSAPNYGGGTGSFLDQLGSQGTGTTTESEAAALSSAASADKQTYTIFENNWAVILTSAQGAQGSLTTLANQCSGEASQSNETLNTKVIPVIGDAQTGIGKAETTLGTLNSIIGGLNQLATGISGTSSTTLDTLAELADEYQSMKNAPTTPTAAEVGQASFDAVDTGSSTPASLFTEMSTIQRDAEGDLLQCNGGGKKGH